MKGVFQMKKLLLHIFSIIALCSLMLGCASAYSEIEIHPGKIFTRGVITDTCYTSEWLGLKYTLTDQMKMDDFDTEGSENAVAEMYASVKEMEDDISILVEKSSANIDQQIKDLKDEIQSRYDTVEFEDISQKSLCDLKFIQLGCASTIDDVQFYQMILFKKIDDRFVFIITNASTKEDCDRLLGGFSIL